MTPPIPAPDLLSELVPLVRRVPCVAGETPTLEEHGSREWLVTTGLGGYASGTVTGALTRRFHGLLGAALPSPLGRQMLLTHLEERLTFRDLQERRRTILKRMGESRPRR